MTSSGDGSMVRTINPADNGFLAPKEQVQHLTNDELPIWTMCARFMMFLARFTPPS
jgi:D-lyxose ketol-isomerase